MPTDPRAEMIAAAESFYGRGWMVGTAGNLSARVDDGSFWITVSGKDKGALTPTDFIRVDEAGHVLEQFQDEDKPSAETSIHRAIYRLFPNARACFHVHSVSANLVSFFSESAQLRLPPLEMLKGLNIWEEAPRVSIPTFANDLHVPKVADAIEARFQGSSPEIPALLVRGHGVTTWASSARETRNRIEILEFIFRYMVEARKIQIQQP